MKLTDELISLKKILYEQNSLSCDYSFLCYLVWQEKYKRKIINKKNCVLIQLGDNNSYKFPLIKRSSNFAEKDDGKKTDTEKDDSIAKLGSVAKSDFAETTDSLAKSTLIEVINELIKLENLTLECLTAEQKKFLEKNFSNIFEFTSDRDEADYIYDINELSTLSGRKFTKKRNHLNNFLKEYADWNVAALTKANLSEVLDFANSWYKNKFLDENADIKNLEFEKKAIIKFLPELASLDADSLVLYVNDKVAGFTVGYKSSLECVDIIFEKADESIKGAYNIINREFAKFLKNKYPDVKYLNRENDLGVAGLRQAKLSYNPCLILEKFSARLK